MFDKNNQKNAKSLDLTADEFEEFIKRQLSFINKHGINSKTLKTSYFILDDIKSKRIEKREWISNLPELVKHGQKIADLKELGNGSTKIKKLLDLKASRTSIANFLRENGLQNG